MNDLFYNDPRTFLGKKQRLGECMSAIDVFRKLHQKYSEFTADGICELDEFISFEEGFASGSELNLAKDEEIESLKKKISELRGINQSEALLNTSLHKSREALELKLRDLEKEYHQEMLKSVAYERELKLSLADATRTILSLEKPVSLIVEHYLNLEELSQVTGVNLDRESAERVKMFFEAFEAIERFVTKNEK